MGDSQAWTLEFFLTARALSDRFRALGAYSMSPQTAREESTAEQQAGVHTRAKLTAEFTLEP